MHDFCSQPGSQHPPDIGGAALDGAVHIAWWEDPFPQAANSISAMSAEIIRAEPPSAFPPVVLTMSRFIFE